MEYAQRCSRLSHREEDQDKQNSQVENLEQNAHVRHVGCVPNMLFRCPHNPPEVFVKIQKKNWGGGGGGRGEGSGWGGQGGCDQRIEVERKLRNADNMDNTNPQQHNKCERE